MRHSLTLLIILATVCLQGCSRSQPPLPTRPNIILILADDLGIGDLGVYGQQHIATPHIDRLAAGGMRFTDFYAGTTVCAPSRSALLTGQHTGHTYIRGNKEIEPEGQEPLADSIETLAMALQQAGYATGAFGKWGLGMVGSSGDPNRKGFDTFFGYNCQRQSHRYYPTHLWDNGEKFILQGNNLTQKVHYAPELIQERTLAFIESHQNEPFFLFVPTILPHAELVVPDDEFYQRYASAFEETPHQGNDYGPDATVPGYASVEKPRATHAAMVSRLDHYVGEIVAKIESLGLADNTIILFTSDNGPHREGGADPDFFKSAGQFRGYKRDLYEGGIRVPLIVNWPGTVAAGTTSSHIAAFWDLFPTFTELAGVPTPTHTDGISFVPTLRGTGEQAAHPYLYWEFHEAGGRQAVREGDWKLVKQGVKHAEAPRIELFDLKQDPAEQHDLAAEHPEVVRRLLQYIEAAHVPSPLFPLLPAPQD